MTDESIGGLAFTVLCFILLVVGVIVGAGSQRNGSLIEKCNETNGKYDFCEKREYWVVK
jgi:hypothetical protein